MVSHDANADRLDKQADTCAQYAAYWREQIAALESQIACAEGAAASWRSVADRARAADLDLSLGAIFAPTAGDALALRGDL